MKTGRFSAIAITLLSASALAQPGPEGHWEGVLKHTEREVGLGLDIGKNAKSEWVASLSVPGEKVTGLVVTDLVVSGDTVKFVGVELMMARFELTLAPDGRLKGTVTYPRFTVPVEFQRTGEAKVKLMDPSPAVSRALEGDWEGSLQVPNRSLRIVFHFRNRADGTLAATIDTPDSGAMGLPLNDVRQTGKAVEVGIRIAHARFRGTLNEDGTELAGEFTHGENSAPLVMRKR